MICLIPLMIDCLLPNGKRVSEVIFSARTLCTCVTWSTQDFVIENFFLTMELSISSFAFHLHSLFVTYALKATYYSLSLKLEKGYLQQPTQKHYATGTLATVHRNLCASRKFPYLPNTEGDFLFNPLSPTGFSIPDGFTFLPPLLGISKILPLGPPYPLEIPNSKKES